MLRVVLRYSTLGSDGRNVMAILAKHNAEILKTSHTACDMTAQVTALFESYYDLNDDPEADNYEYKECVLNGRNLAPYHCSFKVGDQEFNFYDLKVIKEAFTTPNKTNELRKRV
jgi:hypothetical protein